MTDKTLTPRAIKDFQDIEKEINALMTMALAREFNMRKEIKGSKFKRQAYMLFILFCNEHMHRYGTETNKAIRSYFKDYSVHHLSELHKGGKRMLQKDKIFKQLYRCLKNVGIKMVTEGWITSTSLQVQFIERQIDILRNRKKTIQQEALQ